MSSSLDRYSGKASYFLYGGTNIPITKLTIKPERKNADSTDSGDYNVATDMICPTQIPVSIKVTASIEGRFRRNTVAPAMYATMFTSLTQIPCTFGLDLSALAGHGLFDISNFQIENPMDEIQTYTAEIVSNGPFTPMA